jgi:SAM-dependent MidA family methyltransferase
MTKISFAEFQERALYGPGGFFSQNGSVGRGGDFITSPSLGNVFARVFGNALDAWWVDLGTPSEFHVFDCGGGNGTLAKAIRDLPLRCQKALRYVVIERSSAALQTLEDEGVPFAKDFPEEPVVGVVFANELLDNLPISLFEFDGDKWREVCVKEEQPGIEVFREVLPFSAEQLDSLVPEARAGTRVPLQTEARGWVAAAKAALTEGRVVCIDYTRTTSEMASLEQHEWLRTYRGQQPGEHPLQHPGSQDITCDVAVDQLPVAKISTQAEFLERFGVKEIREEARAQWEVLAASGGLEAMKARSMLSEIEALTDAAGLGGFTVFEWEAG